jgi:hypothetical protein
MVRRAVVARVSGLYDHRPKLIRAAADYAEQGEGEPPSDLVLLWDWQKLGTPPHSGGLLDQPAGFLQRAKYLEYVYHLMRLWYSGNAHQIGKRDKATFDYVLRLRKQHANTR